MWQCDKAKITQKKTKILKIVISVPKNKTKIIPNDSATNDCIYK